jgi:cupin fold WbuC family metalloprotein
MRGKNHPMALPAPETRLTPIDKELLLSGVEASRGSPRRRIIRPLHKHGGDILQRMFNTLQPGSYIRPHRHAGHRAESIVVLSGSVLYLAFDDAGEVAETFMLTAGSDVVGIDTDGGIWHSFVALEPDTVLFEVKPGPYVASSDKKFAAWAPEEDAAEAKAYLEELLQNSTTSL